MFALVAIFSHTETFYKKSKIKTSKFFTNFLMRTTVSLGASFFLTQTVNTQGKKATTMIIMYIYHDIGDKWHGLDQL